MHLMLCRFRTFDRCWPLIEISFSVFLCFLIEIALLGRAGRGSVIFLSAFGRKLHSALKETANYISEKAKGQCRLHGDCLIVCLCACLYSHWVFACVCVRGWRGCKWRKSCAAFYIAWSEVRWMAHAAPQSCCSHTLSASVSAAIHLLWPGESLCPQPPVGQLTEALDTGFCSQQLRSKTRLPLPFYNAKEAQIKKKKARENSSCPCHFLLARLCSSWLDTRWFSVVITRLYVLPANFINALVLLTSLTTPDSSFTHIVRTSAQGSWSGFPKQVKR